MTGEMCHERTCPAVARALKSNSLHTESVGHVRFDDRFMTSSEAAHGESADFAVFTCFRGYRLFAELWHATELPTGGNLSLRFYVSYVVCRCTRFNGISASRSTCSGSVIKGMRPAVVTASF
eukprot:6575584-Prymnesium_polylepis.1